MKDTEIQTEIARIIETRMAQGQPAKPSWIVHEIITHHPEIVGADKDFYECCAYGHVATCVREVLRKETANEAKDDPQFLLPGYKRLHRRYSIVRGGEQMIVPIENMSTAELHAKATEYFSLAAGMNEHGREVLRYIARREAATVTELTTAS